MRPGSAVVFGLTLAAWTPLPQIGQHTITTTVRWDDYQLPGYSGDDEIVTVFEVLSSVPNSSPPTAAPSQVPSYTGDCPTQLDLMILLGKSKLASNVTISVICDL